MGKISTVVVPILTVALVGTAYWGYQEHQEKNDILIKAENQYQAAFHNLTYYMDSLQDELGKSIAMNTRQQLGPCLTNVWRLAYTAQNSVGQLPLTLMPFNKTEAFLAKMGDFSYKAAVRDLEKDPLTDEEYKTLKSLYTYAGEIQTELQKVQDQIFAKNLRWMDVESALASADKKQDNSIIDGFKLVDEKVSGYNDVDFSMLQNNEEIKLDKLKKLKGKEISEEDAKNIALQFLGIKDGQKAKVTKTNKGAFFGAYDISIENPKSEADILLEVTKKGGHVIWMLDSRGIGEALVSIPQAQTKASRFLISKNMNNFEVVKTERYDNIAVFTYVENNNGILVYPDAVTVKVALDNGQIVGFHAEDYIVNRGERKFKEPTVSLEQAKKLVNPNLKLESNRLALIINDLNKEVLCYEFSGTIDKGFYRIYINAETGDEEKVEKIKYIEEEKI